MVGDDELASAHNSLIDHLRRNVCGQEDGADIASRVTYLHSRVIPILLGTPWRYRFYAIDNLPKEHLFLFLFRLFKRKIGYAGVNEDVIPLDEFPDV